MRVTIIAAAVSLALAGPAAFAQNSTDTDGAKTGQVAAGSTTGDTASSSGSTTSSGTTTSSTGNTASSDTTSSSANTASSDDTASSSGTASSGPPASSGDTASSGGSTAAAGASAGGTDSKAAGADSKEAAGSTASGASTTASGSTSADAEIPAKAHARRLIGQDVENPDGDNIGKVKDLVIDPKTGQIQQVVVGVGGFLGIGDKDVALPWNELQIRHEVRRTAAAPATPTPGSARAPESSSTGPGAPATRADRAPGSETPTASREVVRSTGPRIVVNRTKEQLEGAPKYEEDKGTTLSMAPTGGSPASAGGTAR